MEEKEGERKKEMKIKWYGGQTEGIGKQKKDDFPFTIEGSFFKSGMGRLSKSMKQYTPLPGGPLPGGLPVAFVGPLPRPVLDAVVENFRQYF